MLRPTHFASGKFRLEKASPSPESAQIGPLSLWEGGSTKIRAQIYSYISVEIGLEM
jgi:hypothetical protein